MIPEHSLDKPDVLPSTTNVNVRFVPSLPIEIEITMKSSSIDTAAAFPSLFQIAVHIEEFAQAITTKTVQRLEEMPFADVVRRWEEQARTCTANGGSDTLLAKSAETVKQAPRVATSKSKKTGKAPESSRRKKTEFSLKAPTAKSVKLVADFTDWEKAPLDMEHLGQGLWSIAVPLQPGHYVYRYLVDGQWCDDPKSNRRIANAYGTLNAVIEVT
jgi:hypothetical protein